MKRYLSLFIMVIANLYVMAQKDTVRSQTRINTTTVTHRTVILDSLQEKWLNRNYARINNLSRKNASASIRRAFPSISEASLEYIISQSAQLVKGDNAKDLAVMQQVLESLNEEKKALLKKIMEKEAEMNKTADEKRKAALGNEIVALKKRVIEVNRTISDTEARLSRE